MFNCSPGPYQITGQSEAGRYITIKAANGRTVARVPWSTDKQGEAGQATDHSDALLLAASWDMLEALEVVRKIDLPLHAAKAVDFAIKKAKGQLL